VSNIEEQFISALFKERNIYAALEHCSEDICCYSSLSHHACQGKENMLIMLVKLMEVIPEDMTYNIKNTMNLEISKDNVAVYVEFNVYKPDQTCWMHGRSSIIRTLQNGQWKMRYLHSSGYDIQMSNAEQVIDSRFYHDTIGFLGTDISFWYYDILNKRIIHNDHSIEIHGFTNVVENVPEFLIESRYVHPESAADFCEMYDRLRNGETRVTGDFWIKPNHMDNYWCERIVYTNVYSINNIPMIAMGISKDVTSEKLWNINTMSGGQQEEVTIRENLKKQIKKAIDENEFEIHLQPKINSREHKVCGAEALIRWNHPKQGILLPGQFIPKLENSKLTYILDCFAFKRVCEYQKERMNRNLTIFPISSNLSLHSLCNPKVIDYISEVVLHMDLPKEVLVIEVTETAFVSDTKIALKHIEVLKALGIKISMDDFGCGSSSFSQLANMPVDELKIDRRLVQNAASTKRGNAILLSILKLAEWLDIPVVAEGMETEKQAEYLNNVGCIICQGFYYSKPLSIQDFERYELNVDLK
jgi:EAL domain-containing protein (putative c-di-GMP-specific phosphodiesterase class I)